jgi:hypothetical protein
MAVWYSLWSFSILVCLDQETSGNPGIEAICLPKWLSQLIGPRPCAESDSSGLEFHLLTSNFSANHSDLLKSRNNLDDRMVVDQLNAGLFGHVLTYVHM